MDTHTFTHLGKEGRSTFLTVSVWDSGFGPSTTQYVEFYVSGLPDKKSVPFRDAFGAPFPCAPKALDGTNSTTCSGTFFTCFYNWDVTHLIDPRLGGTMTVHAISHGILSSSCPHVDVNGRKDPVFVRYELSVDAGVPTPMPSVAPTEEPTKGSTNVFNNGLTIDIDKLGFVNATQISFAAAVLFAAFGAALCRVAEADYAKCHQHKMLRAAIEFGLIGADIVNSIFLYLQLAQSGYSAYAIAIAMARALGGVVGVYFLRGIYGKQEVQDATTYAHLLDSVTIVMGPNSKIYGLVSIISCLDPAALAYLPWLNSPFTRLAMGYPNMEIFRVVSYTTIVATFAYVCLQIPYLASYRSSDPTEKGFSGLSIALSCIKLCFSVLEFVIKQSTLRKAQTDPDLVGLGQWAKKEGESGNREEVRRHSLLDFSNGQNHSSTTTVGFRQESFTSSDISRPTEYVTNPLFAKQSQSDDFHGSFSQSGTDESVAYVDNPLHMPRLPSISELELERRINEARKDILQAAQETIKAELAKARRPSTLKDVLDSIPTSDNINEEEGTL